MVASYRHWRRSRENLIVKANSYSGGNFPQLIDPDREEIVLRPAGGEKWNRPGQQGLQQPVSNKDPL
jgi:hypothetical protein